jgi:hypothetical protein
VSDAHSCGPYIPVVNNRMYGTIAIDNGNNHNVQTDEAGYSFLIFSSNGCVCESVSVYMLTYTRACVQVGCV